MHIAVFSAKAYDHDSFERANGGRHDFRYLTVALSRETAVSASGCRAACIFVNDRADEAVLQALALAGIRILALRSAGFDHVDLAAAKRAGIRVVRVPTYSPHAIAEHAIALLLMLDRKLHIADRRVRARNFSLDGLVGFNLFGKKAGLVGTGAIGAAAAGIFRGFGCEVLATDPDPDPVMRSGLEAQGVRYVPFDELLAGSDVVSLHLPMSPGNAYLMNEASLGTMKRGAMLINTSRGGLLDTRAAIDRLASRHLGGLGLDVYESEIGLFFEERSAGAADDAIFARLLSFPNVVVTGHQAFLTEEALAAIAQTTIANLDLLDEGEKCRNELSA